MPQSSSIALDNFDLLRLVAALIVFFTHSFALYHMGWPLLLSPPQGLLPIAWGDYGVSIFFVISGYLVMGSLQHSRTVAHFMWKRALRIYPALFFNVVVVAILIVPATLEVSLWQYWVHITEKFVSMIYSLLVLAPIQIPDAFPSAYKHDWNGSLWTLQLEGGCYVIIGVFGIVNRWVKWVFPIIFLSVLAFQYEPIFLPHKSAGHITYLHIATFFTGSLFFLFRKYIPWNVAIALLSVLVLALLFICNWYFLPLYMLAVAYLTLYIALYIPYLGNVRRYGDLSYGVYIYAWPIQQTFALLFSYDRALFWPYVILTLVFTLFYAFLSWHLVEKPALRLKNIFISKDAIAGNTHSA